MNMMSWAEREIEIACKKENPDWDGESFDYGCSVYKNVADAYKVLANGGHSGFSWSMATQILYRLMQGKPLTPITDDDFVRDENSFYNSEEYLKDAELIDRIQCPRMSSLFKKIHLDNSVTYSDIDRYYCFDVNNPKNTWRGGGASTILDEFFPITMPYCPPSGSYQVACESFLVDDRLGDFDTRAFHFIVTPDGEKVEVNRFSKEVLDGEPKEGSYETASYIDENGNTVEGTVYTYTHQPTKWVEITKEEFEERKMRKINEDINKETTEEIS